MASGIFPLLNVSNLDKTVEWYRNLGLKAQKGSEGGMEWATVEAGGNPLVLFPKDASVENQPPDTQAWLSGELGKGVLINIGVADARKVWAKAQLARMDVDLPLTEMPYGGREFWLVDPDGYVIVIADKFPGDGEKKKSVKPAKRAKATGKRGKAAGAKRAKVAGKRRR